VNVSAHSAVAYTATLLVIVNLVKGGGRAPPPSPAWANFTLMIECTPESNCCYSVYSVEKETLCGLYLAVRGVRINFDDLSPYLKSMV
jgi:hypothetical protein